MSFIERDFRLQVFLPDDEWTVPGTPELDFTVPNDRISVEDRLRVGGQSIEVAKGRAASKTWRLDILDDGNYWTAKIGDADERIQLTGRLVRFQVRDDGGSWTTWATGRLQNQDDNQTHWTIEVTDERKKERGTEIFRYNTTTIFPMGPRNGWRMMPSTPNGRIEVVEVNGEEVTLQWTGEPEPPDRVIQKIIADVNDGESGGHEGIRNFKNLVCHVDGVDRPIIKFQGGAQNDPVAGLQPEGKNAKKKKKKNFRRFTVWWPEEQPPGPFSAGQRVFNNTFLHMPTHDPDSDLALHIGNDGMGAGDFWEEMYEGEYMFYNYARSPAMDSGSGGVADDFAKSGGLNGEASYSIDQSAQKISLSNASAAGEALVRQERIHGVYREYDGSLWTSFRIKTANLTGDAEAIIRIRCFDKDTTELDGDTKTGIKPTDFGRKFLKASIPKDTMYAEVEVGLSVSAGDSGDIWINEAAVEGGRRPNILIDRTQISKLNQDLPQVSPRTEESATLASWMEKHFYKALGLVPFITRDGKVSPQIVTLPTEDELADVTALTEFGNADTEDQIDFEVAGAEQITQVIVEDGGFFGGNLQSGENLEQGEAFDRVKKQEGDRAQEPGGRSRTFEPDRHGNRVGPGPGMDKERYDLSQLSLVVRDAEAAVPFQPQTEDWEEILADNVLQRFQDGPIKGKLTGFPDVEDLNPGDYIRINKGYYPDVGGGTRGTEVRVAQVIERVFTLDGPELELLDVGPALQPLPTPTISAVKNTDRPRHAVDVTLDTLPSGAELVHIETAISDTEPAADSTLWQFRDKIEEQGNTVTIGQNPGGETVWVRAVARAPQRVGSGASTPISISLDALPTPSNLTVSSITGSQANFSWSNGSTEYVVVFLIDGDVWEGGVLAPGSTVFTAEGLSVSTNYTPTVRYEDPYGGESGEATLSGGGNGDGTFTSGANADKLASPHGMFFVAGETI